MVTLRSALQLLKSYQSDKVLKSLEHFGIPSRNAYGITNPSIKLVARQIGKNHDLAVQLWHAGILEAMILASLIADPKRLTEFEMDEWITKIESWSVCDAVCGYLFCKTDFAYKKAMAWSYLKPEYEKRAGFVLMATLAVHDKKAHDEKLVPFFKRMEEEAFDERNFVRKAVNWALRQCGKRSLYLHEKALVAAENISNQNSKSARWIASDAIRELNSVAVLKRLNLKASKVKNTQKSTFGF